MIVISDNEEDQQSRNTIKEVIDHLESKWDKGGTLGSEGLKTASGKKGGSERVGLMVGWIDRVKFFMEVCEMEDNV